MLMANLNREVPISAFEETLGMIYFARMLDKIRKHAAHRLREDFIENMGRGFDLRCVRFLRVDYEALREKTLKDGETNEALLRWCFVHGRELSEGDIHIWNQYLSKVGWNDAGSANLMRRKRDSGLEHRDDIQTMLDFFEVDEQRRE